MELQERKDYEEEETTQKDIGTTLITIGFIFWLFDIFLLLFVGRDIREGSFFFVSWEIAQAVAGAVLIFIGVRQKMKAHVKDDA